MIGAWPGFAKNCRWLLNWFSRSLRGVASHGRCESFRRQIRIRRPAPPAACRGFRHMRCRRHGQGFSARTHQDPAGAAADLRRSRGAQHGVPARCRRQSVGGRASCGDRRLRRLCTAGLRRIFPRPPAAGDRFDRRRAAESRRLSVSHHWRNPRPRPWLGRRAQFRQPDAADGVLGRDRGNAGAAGRARRARSRERRRLLSARPENRAPPAVR